MFLDDAARTAFARAVEQIEAGSAVEVVVAIRRRSAAYRHANVIVGAVIAFAALAVMLFAEESFSLASILVDPFVVGAVAGGLVEVAPQVKRWLTSRKRLRAEVLRAARAAFVERGVHATTGRSGVLVYISWLEQEVALVPDLGIAAELPDGAIAAAEDALRGKLSAGGAAVADELARLATAMGVAMPHRDDDVNELPDAIDSDMRHR
jgi:putative membrane protein